MGYTLEFISHTLSRFSWVVSLATQPFSVVRYAFSLVVSVFQIGQLTCDTIETTWLWLVVVAQTSFLESGACSSFSVSLAVSLSSLDEVEIALDTWRLSS